MDVFANLASGLFSPSVGASKGACVALIALIAALYAAASAFNFASATKARTSGLFFSDDMIFFHI